MAVLSDAQREAGWTIAKLGDITTKIGSGSTPRGGKSSYVDEGPMVIRSQNVLDNELDLSDVARVPEELTVKLKSVLVQKGDTLLNITGSGNTTIGRSALVNEDLGEAYVNQHVCIIRPNKSLVNEIFLQKSIFAFKDELLGLSYGSTRDALTKGIIESFEIPLPPLEEQGRIAGILGSLDDKIEANTRLIQTIKEYMTALYKAEAKNGKVLELTDIADFVNGRAFTKDATGTGRVVIRIAELNNGLGASTVYNDIEVKEENTAYPGDVLMSWSGSLDTYVWHLPEAIINQHIFKVIPKGNYPKWLVYHACKSVIEDFQAIAVDKATTMGHIRRGDLKRDISIPAQEMPQMENLWNLWMNLEQENLQLAETRDALIKRLIG